MSCYYSLENPIPEVKPFVDYLVQKLGNDTDVILRMIGFINNPSFKSLYPSFDNLSVSAKYDIASKYYMTKRHDGRTTVMPEYANVSDVGHFSSMMERREAVNAVTGIMIKSYFTVMSEEQTDVKPNKEYFIQRVKNTIANKAKEIVFDMCDKDSKFNDKALDIFDKYSGDETSAIIEILGSTNNATNLAWANLLIEINDTESTFMEEVTSSPDLNWYNRDLTKEDAQEPNTSDQENNAYPEGFVGIDVNDVDLYTALWGDGDSGLFSNAIKHVNSIVRAYLGGLEKLKSTNTYLRDAIDENGNVKKDEFDNPIQEIVYDYDRSNIFRMTNLMNVEDCVDMLYHRVDTSSATEMVASIRRIAEQQPGFEAFIQLANLLETNDQMRYLFYNTFGKNLITKNIVTYEDGIFVNRISNPNTDKANALRGEYLNLAKHSVLNVGDIDIKSSLINTKKQIQEFKNHLNTIANARKKLSVGGSKNDIDSYEATIKDSTNKANKLKAEIVKFIGNDLRIYIPTITDDSIASFISDSERGTVTKNINDLVAFIDSLYSGGYQSYYNKIVLDADAGTAWRNWQNLMSYDSETDESRGTQDQIKEARNAYFDIIKSNYLDESFTSTIYDLANTLFPYTSVSSDLNSPNVHKNLSSDVINSSYLTFLKTVLNRPVKVRTVGNKTVIDSKSFTNFAKTRFGANYTSHQYDYSNILFQNGDIQGLFTIDEFDNIVPVKNAHELIKINLYNGSANNETEDAATYTEISHNDFIATAFVQYFRPNINGGLNSATQGNYFVRTQSDAPKIFDITAPKYNTGKLGEYGALLSVADPESVNRLIVEANAEIRDAQEANSNDKHSHKVTLEQMISLITKRNLYDIKLGTGFGAVSKRNINNKNVDVLKVSYTTTTDDKEEVFTAYFTGTRTERNGIKYFTNPKFLEVGNMANMPENMKDALYKSRVSVWAKEGKVKFNINQNHAIYRQFKNAYMQELTNAGQALVNIFEYTTEEVTLDDGSKTYRVKFETDSNDIPKVKAKYAGKNSYKLYDKYHHHDGEIVKWDAELKRYVLTGNVFGSNRFTICTEDRYNNSNLRNYGDELLKARKVEGKIVKPVIDFLYGGENSGLTIYCDNEGNFDSIDFVNNTQEAAIDNMLNEFINDSVSSLDTQLGNAELVIPSNYKGFDNIVNFALNYQNMYINMDDLLEGDSKFYDGPQDFLKRAKECQAGGTPYGISNFLGDPFAPITVVDSVLGLKNSPDSIKFYMNNDKNRPILLRNKFTAITIKNTIKMSDDARALEDYIIKNHIFSDDEEKNAKEAKEYISHFDRTKTNDAQSYITFEEWVRRVVAMGEYYKYADVIEKVINNKDLNASDIKSFIQVQKNFYYDIHFNSDFNHTAPRQIKNAEFVLIPQLLDREIHNSDGTITRERTDLGKLYDFMIENNIDQVNTAETSKAGKANVLTLWDNDGVAQWDSFNEQFNDARDNDNSSPVEEFSYTHLYRQQEVPQHVDGFNKAGIQITKKIIDNIPDVSQIPQYFDDKGEIKKDLNKQEKEVAKLAKLKEKFLNLYCTNIQQSYEKFGRLIGAGIDENGNFKRTPEGELLMDINALYGKLREEAKRLGCNSNELEFLTLDRETNAPIMPSDVNIFANKFENIVNSLINKYITRQQLPGFHAAQVTGLGISEKFSGRNGQIKTASEWKGNKLRYHPIDEKTGKAQPYIEVVVPRFKVFEGLTDHEIFEVFDENGKNLIERLELDKIIGYRIPTEGNQSVAVMKIVGFVDKVQGSTIIVPDDWVAQTGADFDVDSIYAINYNMYKVGKTDIRRHRMSTATTISAYLNRYEDYLDECKRNYDERSSSGYFNERKKHIDAAKANYDDAKQKLDKAFQNLINKKTKPFVDKLDSKTKSEFYKITGDKSTKLQEKAQKIVDTFGPTAEPGTPIKKIVNYNQAFLDALNRKDEKKSEKNDAYEIDVDELNNTRLDNLRQRASEIGAMSFEDFKELSIEEQNNKEARDAEILDTLIEILSSDYVLESTLSQSNFREITATKKEILAKDETKRKARSVYNFFDQANYQEEVMSGAILKALSVSRDTFCSICNKVRPTINKPINIVYEEYDRHGNRRTEEELRKRFDIVRVVETGKGKNKKKQFIVTHNKLGWSNDNRNIDGKFITIYTSQTTAFHLDAVKEGSIPNLNTLTFGVYKTFVDLGSDYRTAVAFITQHGVSRILNAYDKSRSIFNKDYNNVYVDTALKDIARDLEIKVDGVLVDEFTPIDEVIKAINEHPAVDEFRDAVLKPLGMLDSEIKSFTFGKETGGIYNMGFRADLLKDRRNNDGVFKDNKTLQLLFDAAVVLQYHSLSGTAENITNYASVCSPDKFGAKQTTFETNKVFFDIAEFLNRGKKPSDIFLKVYDEQRKPTDMLEQIYPGIRSIINADGTVNPNNFTFSSKGNSSYPTLYYFLKYSSGTSIAITKQLFNMHRDNIEKKLYEIADKNHLNVPINEKLYLDFKRYVMTDAIYHNSVMNIDEKEANRILGYGRKLILDYEVDDITNPTEKEKKEYRQLSPAQKLLFCKNNFDDSLIGDFLSANIYTSRTSSKLPNLLPQTVNYNVDNKSIEVAFDNFKQCYFNSNFFLKELAIDLVNYAMIAEGYQVRRTAVSKIVPNDVLRAMNYDSIIQFTTNNAPEQLFTDSVYENYIRSHSEKVKSYRINSNSGFDFSYANGRLDVINLGNPEDTSSKGRHVGIIDENGDYPAYLRFKKSDMDILMKALIGDDDNLYYYPVNKLESYEHGEKSANQENNIYFKKEAYEHRILNASNERKSRAKFTAAFAYEIKLSANDETPFDINDIDNEDIPRRLLPHAISLKNLRQQIIDNNNSSQNLPGVEPPLFVISNALSELINRYSEQNINGSDYMIMKINTFNTDMNKISDGFKHSVNWYLNQYAKGNEEELQSLNKSFYEVIRTISESDEETNRAYRKKLFVIARKAKSVKKSTLGDVTGSVISNIYEDRNFLEGNPLNYAYDATRRFRNEEITKYNPESIEDNINTATDIIRRYVENSVRYYTNQIEDFDLGLDMEDKHSIDSKEVMDKVIDNPIIGESTFRNEFLKFILNYNNFIDKYKIVQGMHSDDYDIQKNIEEINEAYRKIASPEYKNKVDAAAKKFLIEFAKVNSTDDLIFDDLLTITEGFNKIGDLESWLTDALEAGIPLMQVMLKEVIGNVEAARMSALKESAFNVDKFDDIEKEALSSGERVNYDNIIDPSGRFWRDYNEQLEIDYNQFIKELKDIEQEHGKNSVNYITKNHQFKLWKNENFRQYYVKEYYDDYNSNEHDIIYGNSSRGMGAFPEVLSEYKRLNDKLRQIRSDIRKGNGTAEQEKEMLKIMQDISILRGASMIDGIPVERKSLSESGDRVRCKEAADTLAKYLERQDELAKKYNNPVDENKFKERLEDVLNTLSKIESRFEGGCITQDVLMANKEYSKAFKWLRANAKLVIKDEALKQKVSDAFEALRKTDSENPTKGWYQKILRTANAYDAYGIVNGQLLNDAQIDEIKNHEMIDNNYNPGSLIKPIVGDGIIYTDAFYNKLIGKGVKNARWKQLVLDANKILENGYNRKSRVLDLSLLTTAQLKKLKTIYELLNSKDIRKYAKTIGADKRAEYIQDNVDFETDYNAYEVQRQLALSKQRQMSEKDGKEFFAAWLAANTMEVYDKDDGTYETLPNRFLYSYIKPKDKIKITRNSDGEITKVTGDVNHYVDVTKTNAINTIRNNIVDIVTHHYIEASDNAARQGNEYYENWFRRNHIYDSTTNTYMPIKCWIRQEYKGYDKSQGASETSGYEWRSTREYYESSVKDGYKNKSYIPGSASRLENYRTGNTKYDNTSKPVMNSHEAKMKTAMEDILKEYLYGSRKKSILAKGTVPTLASENEDKYTDYKWWGKQALGLAGLNADAEFKEFYEHLDYVKDKEIDIPMLSQLYSRDSKRLPEKISKKNYRPESHGGKTYEEYLEEYNAMKSEYDAINAEVHKNIMDRSDWKKVFKDFTVRAARAKAIEENKALMYFTLHTLKNMQAFKKPLGFTNYIKNRYLSNDEETVYKTESMENEYKVLETFMRRLMYDQRKKNNGVLTKVGNLMQNSASARFMAFNLTGGTVNVTYGETQIWQEAFCKQFFGKKAWADATARYSKSTLSYLHDMYSEKATSKESAIIKLFNVVDTDSVVEFVSNGVSGAIKKFKNLTFGFNSGGEHFMQNKVLFAMMDSHKVVPTFDSEGKVIDVKFMTEELYNRESERLALKELFDKYDGLKVKYIAFIGGIKKDDNERRKYVDRHLYVTEQFLETLKHENRNEIINDYKSIRKRLKQERRKEWEKLDTVTSQFDFDKGYAVFAKDSYLYKLHENDNIDKKKRAWKAVANFRNKVVYVNKKIHGVYDQLGAARLEQEWLGGVFMQFHKHLYPGIMKRYRRQGYYNEVRESVEKGSFTALCDLLHITDEQLAAIHDLSQEELIALKSLRNSFQLISNYCAAVKLRWELIPDHERANIIRNFTDLGFLAMYVAGAAMAKGLWLEEDKKDSLFYNWLMNTIDRTEMELMLYGAGIPGYGPINETKTLWKSPAAIGSSIEDIYKLMEATATWLFGDEEDMYFKTGAHAHENKFAVYGMSLIPGIRAYNHFMDLPKNNAAFKLKSNPLQNWAEQIASVATGRTIEK